MTLLSNNVSGYDASDLLLVRHQIQGDIDIDIDIRTNVVIFNCDGGHTITLNNPTEEMQDVLVKNESLYTITLSINGNQIEMLVDDVVRVMPTQTDGGSWEWFVFGATEVDFNLIVMTEYKLLPDGTSSAERFGFAVDITPDGDKCIIGSNFDDGVGGNSEGAAYIYIWNGSTWILQQKIYSSDGIFNNRFGWSVSISDDGTRCVVGEGWDDSAYTFHYDGNQWSQIDELISPDTVLDDRFGYSVAMSGDGTRCIVGAYAAETGTTGAAYIFVYNSGQNTWDFEQKLLSSNSGEYFEFGYSVSMNSDGSKCIVGEDRSTVVSDIRAGTAYIFSRSGTTWAEDVVLLSSPVTSSESFGKSVTMNGDGTKCIVGIGGTQNKVYYFDVSGSQVNSVHTITTDHEDVSYFGKSVSISPDGMKCIVGSSDQTIGGSSKAGAVYMFEFNGNEWSQYTRFQASDIHGYHYFGDAVSINSDGTKCIVGATGDYDGGDSSGATYIYRNI